MKRFQAGGRESESSVWKIAVVVAVVWGVAESLWCDVHYLVLVYLVMGVFGSCFVVIVGVGGFKVLHGFN